MARSVACALTIAVLCLQTAAGQLRPEGPKTATAGQLIISEFRLRGPNGAQDEFIEIYNASGANHTVAAASGTGYGIAASDGITRCTIPNGTVIPRHGHYLCVNSAGYSLGSYPAGGGATATGDATYTTDIPDNAGIAIFNNNTGGGSYSVANRLDAVGSSSEANTTYKEGTGYPALTPFDIDYSFMRRQSVNGLIDVGNNASDFLFVDTSGSNGGAGQRLGAPGPENLSAPITLNGAPTVTAGPLDECSSQSAAPNRVDDPTSDPANNATFGTIDLRTVWTNNSGASLTRLRFRIIDLGTFPAPAGTADLRARSSTSISVAVDRAPCGAGTSTATVLGTTLEQPPSQPNGGAINSSLSVEGVSPASPLADGASVNVRFLLGIQQVGTDRFCVVAEMLPASTGDRYCIDGSGTRLIISELRLRGQGGAQDEFIEIHNPSNFNHTVAAPPPGSGYGIAASDGVTRCTIPNGTIIPAWGHFLCVNSAAYSLGSYPAGAGTSATGDATYTLDIPDETGIALFKDDLNYTLAYRLDAVGSTIETNALYKEGAGYPSLALLNLQKAWTRRPPGGCTGSALGNCSSVALVQSTAPMTTPAVVDSNDNASDFMFVDTTGTNVGGVQRLGAPGPENLSSPISTPGPTITLSNAKLDSCAPLQKAPNAVHDSTPDPANHSLFGTLDLRRVYTNTTGAAITRLRFRIVDITTVPPIAGVADLRPRSSATIVVPVDRPPCGSGTSSVTVQGTTLEQPPLQMIGGGYSSTMSVEAVTSGTPLSNGASLNVRFLLGIQQTGAARFCVVPETLPGSAGQTFCYIGGSDAGAVYTPADFDNDHLSDVPLYNPVAGRWRLFKSTSQFETSSTINWGGAGLTPVLGDFDGDGRADAAVYSPSTGMWSVLTSGSDFSTALSISWGGAGYVPVPGDYDGDGQTDVAVYQPTTGFWYILESSSGYASGVSISWGGTGYTAIGGQDFDNDKKSDLTIYNEQLGTWYVLQSGSNFTTALSKAWGGPGYTLVPGDYDGDGKADFGLYHRATGYWYVLKSVGGYTSSIVVSWGGPGFVPLPGDYDGDGHTDLGLYQLETKRFLALASTASYSIGTPIEKTFAGVSTNAVPITAAVVPASSREIDEGDFDGDFTSDITVYNTTTGVWSTLKSSTGFAATTSTSWGGTGYTPVPGDYDGDGRGDLGLYQPSSGAWIVLLSSGNFTSSLNKNNGGPGYIPVAGDYDGDGKTDIVTYNPTTGLWFGLKSSTGYTSAFSVSWGGAGYTAAPGDFDGDGKQDLAIYNTSTGLWSILTSSSNYTGSIVRSLGGAGYTPVQADYDGDGITDFAVYQTSTGMWTFLKSSSGNTLGVAVPYGGAGFTPVAGDWDSDGCADIGVYDTAGNWSILLSSGNYATSLTKNWGGAGYAPVPVYP